MGGVLGGREKDRGLGGKRGEWKGKEKGEGLERRGLGGK